MTSSIDTSSIDGNFPVQGADNPSQGFRDNFSLIKIALDTASGEITDLQDAVGNITFTLNTATGSTLGGVKIGSGLTVTGDGTISVAPGGYTLPAATGSILGGVKIGSGLTVAVDGTVSAIPGGYVLPTATINTLGGVRIGSGINILNGIISVTPYSLTTATLSSLGGVKIGSGLTAVGDGTISLNTGTLIANAAFAYSFNTGTLVTNAVNATTATNAAFAYSFNTGTLVTRATTATNAAFAYSFNTGTLVTNAVNATTSSNAAFAYAFNTGTLVTRATTATNAAFAYAFNTGTLVTNAVNATTATNAAFAYSFNTATLVTTAVNATTATNAAFAYAFNTGTLVTRSTTATNAAFAYSFNTGTLVTRSTTATNAAFAYSFNTATLVTTAVNIASTATTSTLGGVKIGSGLTAVGDGTMSLDADTQRKLQETYSVKDAGATGDGVTNDATAFQDAIDTAFAAGGGTVYVPDGTYIINSTLEMKSNVTVSCHPAAVVDFNGVTAGSAAVVFTGTASAEYPFTLARTLGDTSVTLSGSPTFSAGDLVHFVSVRNSLSRVDAGTWWLGDGTASLRYAYYGEFNFIQSDGGGGVYTLAKAFIFPGYRVDASNETETLRTTSAAQKITPCENAHWIGGTLKRDASGSSLVVGTWAYNCTLSNCTILRGNIQGTSVVWTASFQCEGRNIIHRNDPTLAWNYSTMHAKYNRFKTIGSQDCGFVGLNESYGAQSVDFTYGGTLLFCNVRSYCRDSEFSHCFEELTSHPGCYQEQFKNNRILDCNTDGITVRGYEPEVTGNLVTSTYQWTTDPQSSVTFTGSISGTTLTVASSPAPDGTIVFDREISGLGVEDGTTIVSQISGTSGGAGVYVVNISQTVSPAIEMTVSAPRTYGITLAYGGPRRGTVRDNTLRGFAYAFAILGSATQEWFWTNCLLSISNNEVSQCYAGIWTNFSSVAKPVTLTGTISGKTLTVSNSPAPSGIIKVTREIIGSGVTTGTTIVSQASGVTGGTGTYILSTSSSVASLTSMTAVDNSMRFIRYDNNVHSYMGRFVVDLGEYSAGISITNNVMHGGFRYTGPGGYVAFVYTSPNCPALIVKDNVWMRTKGSDPEFTKYFATIGSITDTATYPAADWSATTDISNNYITFPDDPNFTTVNIGSDGTPYYQSINNLDGDYTSTTSSGVMTVIPSPTRVYTAIVDSGTGGGNLDRINPAINCVLQTGDILYLRNSTATKPTLIRDLTTSGTGNIQTPGNTSFTISSVASGVTLMYMGAYWSVISNTLS